MRAVPSAANVAGAMILLFAATGCAHEVATVRTVTPEEYAARSWIGRTAEDVTRAWGENHRKQPDGQGGYTVTFSRMTWSEGYLPGPGGTVKETAVPGTPNAFLPETGGTAWVSTPDDLATFWFGADGRIYRYWFADEIYKKGLDAPDAKPVRVYGRKSP